MQGEERAERGRLLENQTMDGRRLHLSPHRCCDPDFAAPVLT